MKKNEKDILNTFVRYIILILVAIPNLWIFYKVFAPLTVYPVYFLLKTFFSATLFPDRIILIGNTISIELIDACIAGSAYYLLLILNLSVPKIKISRRIYMIFFAFLSFLLVNVVRIFLLGTLAVYKSPLLVLAHMLFWYLLSTIFIVAIWFAEVKIFKVKEIPIYSDVKFLYKNSGLKK